MSVLLKSLTTIALATTICCISGLSQVRSQSTPVTSSDGHTGVSPSFNA